MAWTAPVDPVGGTVITVAYAVQNMLDPIRWLRIMTGNADPPASAYVPVSTSTTGVAWSKVGADALAAGAVVGHLGYTPANAAGQAFSGNVGALNLAATFGITAGSTGISSGGSIGTSANILATGQIQGGSYAGGTQTTGSISLRSLAVGVDGITSAGSIGTNANFLATGQISGGSYAGGSLSVGVPQFLGISAGASGVLSVGSIGTQANFTATGAISGASLGVTGALTAGSVAAVGQVSGGSFTGGTVAAGHLAALGLSAGTDGIVTSGIVTVLGGEQVFSPSNPPPIAGGGASVPSGLIAFIATGAKPTGWDFYTPANGRVIVAAGTAGITNWPAFTVATNAGATDGTHVHGPNTFTVTGAATGAAGTTGPPSGTVVRVQVSGVPTDPQVPNDAHTHSTPAASLGVGGSATGSTAGAAWVPPVHPLNALVKT